jgi:HrpA-like RNA helicase
VAQQTSVIEKVQKSENNELTATMNQEMIALKEQNEKLFSDLETERAKAMTLINSDVAQTAKHEQQLKELFVRIEQMEKERQEKETKRVKLEEIAKTIKTIDYTNIQQEVVHDFLTPKYLLIRDHLRTTVTNVDPSFADRIPMMMFNTNNNRYVVTLVGFQKHHTEFKAMLERIWSLLNIIQSAKDFYQRELNRSIKQMAKDILPQVTPRTQIWRQYTQHFLQIFKDKTLEYKKNFDDYIQEKLKSLVEPCILATLDKPWIVIRKETDDYLRTHAVMEEVEPTKQKALEEFIKQNISQQHLKLDGQPNVKSIAVIQKFIENVRQEFQTDKKYQGHQIEQFSLIPKLLERLMLYYSCFKIQLPLFGFSEDLLDKIDNYAVTTISTSTGSGKSTLLPALLVAEGYDKVIVTQPRRLPCQLICKRVNETMLIDVGTSAKKLAGWAVSGTERNPEAKVLYLTDGLLKERLLYDENFITTQTQVNKSIVFFIDEVHERSVNIDLCLAFLARLLSTKPELKSKMKIIVSSATLDASVPTLFGNIPQIGLAEFKMPQMGTLHPVTKHPRPNENILDLVQELCKKRKRHDQILCFVSSVSDVNQCCRLLGEISRGTIVAYPLVQSQHPNVQQANIEHGTIFFSTTVAETSLTFPCLKYVIDTGMINTPVYDIDSKRTILKEVRAAESTIKQRLGRLGRTQPGEYYSLYSFTADDVPFPIPQICQSDLMNLEFSLMKSPLQKGLNYLKRFLPDSPTQPAINKTIEELKKLGILETGSNDRLTNHGKALAQLPDFGSLAMSKAVLDALCNRNCGHDLICLASILGVLNTTILFKSIPQNLKSPDGDFMTLLNVMNEILLVRQSVATHQFNIEHVCQAKGLSGITHILRQALRRYTTLEKLFNLSDRYRQPAQIKSGDWEMIARALLEGYSDHVFVSMRDLQDRNLHFVRYNSQSDTVAVLDLQSTLTRPINTAPVSLVLARDIRHSTAIRAKAVLSFVGEIKAEWLDHKIERQVDLFDDEDTYISSPNKYSNVLTKFSHRIGMQKNSNTVSLKGSAGIVLAAELHLRQEMISELRFTLQELGTGTSHENFSRNLKSVMKMTRIFNPLIWRWQAEKQVEIIINSNTSTEVCEITAKGRSSENKKVRQEFASFIGWLRNCAVIRHPNAGKKIHMNSFYLSLN